MQLLCATLTQLINKKSYSWYSYTKPAVENGHSSGKREALVAGADGVSKQAPAGSVSIKRNFIIYFQQLILHFLAPLPPLRRLEKSMVPIYSWLADEPGSLFVNILAWKPGADLNDQRCSASASTQPAMQEEWYQWTRKNSCHQHATCFSNTQYPA